MHVAAMMMAARDATIPTAPDAPSNFIATATGSSTADTTWDDNSNNESLFRVQWDTDVNFGSPSEDTVGPDVTSFEITGLADDTQYHARVRAENGVGNSAWSNTDSFTTDAAGTPPSAPSSLSAATASESSVDLTWIDNSDNEDDFQIHYDTDSGFGSPTSTTAAANATSKTITGLTEGVQYFFRIRARNSFGNSNWSNTASATTKLATPTNMQGVDEGSFIRFSWNDNSNKEANYEIYKDGSLFDTLSANTTQYDVSEPTSDGSWKVKAVHSTIPDSNFSNTVSGPPWPS